MAQVQINDYVENNSTNVYSTTAKSSGNEVRVGDAFGGGTVIPDIGREISKGVVLSIVALELLFMVAVSVESVVVATVLVVVVVPL